MFHKKQNSVARSRKQMMLGLGIAFPLTVVIWLLLALCLPPVPNMDLLGNRLFFAFGCIAVATLLTFFLGIEAVSHERLFTKAINPLLGLESERLKINLRYLQQTFEQLLVFIPGILMLAFYLSDGYGMRIVVASTVTWILARFAFWIGYHKAPTFRTPGLIGMVQSALILLYVSLHFSYDYAGIGGAIIVFIIFAGVEIFLVRMSKKAGVRESSVT